MNRTLQPQDHISHFRVVGPLGAGGMGEVYIATDESLERSVALKILPPQLVRDEERVRRFVTEAKSASSLNHPNIVTIYEIGKDRVRGSEPGATPEPSSEPLHFISMELVAGETLGQKIHEEKTDLRTLIGYMAQAAEGIAKAHASGIVHRDLKPGNIMISKDGFAKVLDFGLAKLTEKQLEPGQDQTDAPTKAATTGAGILMGTVGYMSPEQVQTKTVDHRSDIFSMGCILYEAATRRRPFVAPTDVEVMHQILRERPAPVEELNPEVPAEVRRIIRRCLAKSPDQRFQSMKDLAIELREVCDDYESLSISGATGPTSIPSRALGAPPLTRRGWMAGMAAMGILGVAGLVFGLYALLGRHAPSGDAGPSVQDLKMSVLMSRDDLTEAVLSSDGRYLAYVSSGDDKSTLNVRQVRTGSDMQILPPQEYLIHGVSFSPDGDYLYYLNQDPDSPAYSALYQVASLGGTPRKILFDIDTAAAFSPDGASVCFRRGVPQAKADTLVVAELDSRKERELVRIQSPENFTTAPAWSPDGRSVAVAIQRFEGGIRSWISVIDVATGKQLPVGSKTFNAVNSVGWLPDGKAIVLGASVAGTPAPQIYRLAYPGGDPRKLTSDLSGYGDLSISTAGHAVAAVRRTGVSNVWVAPVDGGKEARPITFATGATGSSKDVVPLHGGAVAFTVDDGDKTHVWRSESDGSNRQQLESRGLYAVAPRYAERAGILFNETDEKELVFHIWRVDPDGGGLRQLTNGKGESMIDLSGDGRVALFLKWDDPTSLWSIDPVEGGEPKQLASSSGGDVAQISPDGRLVCYGTLTEVQGRIYVRHVIIPVSGGQPVAQFLLPPGATKGDWSPDSKSMTYIDRNKGWNLMRQPIAGGEPSQLTHFVEGQTTDFTWSPDGRHIAVVRRSGRKDSVWVIEPGVGEPKQVAGFATGAISECRWALDGKSVLLSYGTASQDVVLISGVH